MDAEDAHALTLRVLRLMAFIPPARWAATLAFLAPDHPVQAFGLHFRNPVGLAAGFDKDALAVRGLAALGFGHIEVGTVTPLPQKGNPRPRLFRLVEDRAIINRMGFPSAGSVVVMRRLKRLKKLPVVLGVNLGKNSKTPNEEAVFDYLALLQNFAPLADYLAINVSSPNTVGLRELQGKRALEALLEQLDYQRRIEQKNLEKRIPLLVKLAPDLSETELDEALEAIVRTRMDGVIVTNTTVSRGNLRSPLGTERGGLSGDPLRVRSEAVLRFVVRRLDGRIPVVSVGGIMSAEDAKRRLEMGAALVQVYSGLVYRGPGLVREILRAL
ncbi:MAG: quinone-dependent dihydroorotate dehydrogenase [Anaerolineae bacterium]|nr:MAG: quinone-dependent dihydroorotate dehydrogenase [Anaerolineae bacterium]